MAEWIPSFSVVVTAVDETWSVRETIERIITDNKDDVCDIVMAIASHTTTACRAVIAEMEEKYPGLVRYHEQCRLPGVGGANQECAELIDTEWVIFMASDLETPPETVKDIIACSKREDVDIVATSRWQTGGSFGNYSYIKLLCNWIFQNFFSLLYRTPLTDMTFGFRAYRTALLSRYHWRETGHAFFMESLVKPLRDGKRVAEIPVRWRRRQEGESHIKPMEFLRYFRVGLSVRFTAKQSILKENQ